MKNAHPHTGKWLREWFPEQTKSIGSILLWAAVYLVDTVLVFWAAFALGLNPVSLPYRLTSIAVCFLLVIAFLLFWAETAVYNRILKKYRKSLE